MFLSSRHTYSSAHWIPSLHVPLTPQTQPLYSSSFFSNLFFFSFFFGPVLPILVNGTTVYLVVHAKHFGITFIFSPFLMSLLFQSCNCFNSCRVCSLHVYQIGLFLWFSCHGLQLSSIRHLMTSLILIAILNAADKE